MTRVRNQKIARLADLAAFAQTAHRCRCRDDEDEDVEAEFDDDANALVGDDVVFDCCAAASAATAARDDELVNVEYDTERRFACRSFSD